jgi:hypothetical protein
MDALANCTLSLTARPKFGAEADLSSSDEEEEEAINKAASGHEDDDESVMSDGMESRERRRLFRKTHIMIPGVGAVKLPIGVALDVTFDESRYFSKENRATRERLARCVRRGGPCRVVVVPRCNVHSSPHVIAL